MVEITRSKDGDSFRNGSLDTQHAVVTDTDHSDYCNIRLLDGSGEVIRDVPVANLKLVQPAKKDLVVVVGGQHKGREGFLFSIDADGEEAVVKGSSGDMFLMAMRHVAKRVAA